MSSEVITNGLHVKKINSHINPLADPVNGKGSSNGLANGNHHSTANNTSTTTTTTTSTSNNFVTTSTMNATDTGDTGNWIKLNVGGSSFLTTRSTLCRYPRSFLAVLCQQDSALKSDKDENGAFLIDRDPTYFATILNFLRHGKLILNSGITEEAIVEEAEFYNLPELVQLCKYRIANRRQECQHVYRLFQCGPDELAQTISNISDGWKLKQVVVDRRDLYHNVYLCVMYKEFPSTKFHSDASSCDELSSQLPVFCRLKNK